MYSNNLAPESPEVGSVLSQDACSTAGFLAQFCEMVRKILLPHIGSLGKGNEAGDCSTSVSSAGGREVPGSSTCGLG